MNNVTIDYRDCDRQIWEEDLNDFVPDRILDAHIHMFNRADFKSLSPKLLNAEDNDLDDLNAWAKVLYPGRRMNYLTLGYPSFTVLGEVDVAKQVVFMKSEIEKMPEVRHHRLVTPSCKIEDIARDMEHPQIIGLKPYRTHSVTGDIHQCRIHEFLPHEQMELANEQGLWVTMHLSPMTAAPTNIISMTWRNTPPGVIQISSGSWPIAPAPSPTGAWIMRSRGCAICPTSITTPRRSPTPART